MPTPLKLLIGFVAALAAGWISHGPLGRGEAFIDSLEAQAARALQEAEVPQVQARMKRSPLRRIAVLSGPANDFQRQGQGLFPGINQRIEAIPGIAGIEWSNPPETN
ncbi:MAG: hypothetical protein ACXW2T_01345 [Allosphingosinicella sp.]